MRLRPYQERLTDLTMSALDHDTARPIVDAACGAGKSLIISAVADRILKQNPKGGAVLVVTHRAELVKQNHAKLPAHLRGTIYSASVGKKDMSGQVIFANIQSIIKRWHKLPTLSAILIDECHVASKMYAEFIANVLTVSANVRIIGFTATPFNGGGVWLHMLKEHRIFTGTCGKVGIGELLLEGYLAPLTPYTTGTRLSTDGVRFDQRSGDFNAKDLQAAVDVPELVLRCTNEITSIFKDRKSVAVFCSGVEHAEHVALALGDRAVVVTGDTPKKDREHRLAEFAAGRVKYMVSVDVLTTGWDVAGIDGIACLRPSQSPLVWMQLLGRGMRPHPGKEDCLVADFTHNAEFFGPIDEIEGRPPKNSLGDAPTRICENCYNIILAGLRICPHCGHEIEFAERQPNLDPETGLLVSGIITDERGLRWYPIHDVTYELRTTAAGSEAVVAQYMSPGRKYPVAEDYYCLFDHRTNVSRRAMDKWLKRCLIPGAPTNARDALARADLGGMRIPRMVALKAGSKYPVAYKT